MLALVTCDAAIRLDTDLPLLQRELPEARIVVWDDPEVDWAAFDVVVLRSAWDYHARFEQFLAWARHVSSLTRLWNSLELVEWNTDKAYLSELADAGIPVVTTEFVAVGQPLERLPDLTADLVLKPSVGAGANGAVRTHGDAALARRHISTLHAAGRTVMVQPYLHEVDSAGETGLVFLGGQFSHAFGKAAILTGAVVYEEGLFAEERIERRVATAAEVAVGERVVASLGPTAYARVDLLPSDDGPVVLEVEVIEPSLYLSFDSGAAERAASVFRSLAP